MKKQALRIGQEEAPVGRRVGQHEDRQNGAVGERSGLRAVLASSVRPADEVAAALADVGG